MATAAPHEGGRVAGTNLVSLVTAIEPKGMELHQGWLLGRGSSPVSCQVLEHATQDSGHRPKPNRVQEIFRQHSQKYGLNYGWSCVEPRVGVHDLCGPLPTQDTLQFYDPLVFYVEESQVLHSRGKCDCTNLCYLLK